MLKKIYTKNAPEAIGPYSQAIQYDKLLFSSGQIPVDPENGAIVAGGIAAQAEQVMKNIGAILEKAGTEYSSVLKTTCFLSDMNDFAAVNAVYEAFFIENNAGFPARSCVQVARIPKDAKVEIEVIAAK